MDEKDGEMRFMMECCGLLTCITFWRKQRNLIAENQQKTDKEIARQYSWNEQREALDW